MPELREGLLETDSICCWNLGGLVFILAACS